MTFEMAVWAFVAGAVAKRLWDKFYPWLLSSHWARRYGEWMALDYPPEFEPSGDEREFAFVCDGCRRAVWVWLTPVESECMGELAYIECPHCGKPWTCAATVMPRTIVRTKSGGGYREVAERRDILAFTVQHATEKEIEESRRALRNMDVVRLKAASR